MIVILLNVLIFEKIDVLHLLFKYPMGKWHFKNYLKRVDNILKSLQSCHVQTRLQMSFISSFNYSMERDAVCITQKMFLKGL